jgi:alpha-galactosidase
MPDLPKGVVVETNALFKHDNIEPVTTLGLPVDLRVLVMHHVLTQEGIIEAVFEGDMEKAFRVFSHDLAVQKLPLCDARTLFDEMRVNSVMYHLEEHDNKIEM